MIEMIIRKIENIVDCDLTEEEKEIIRNSLSQEELDLIADIILISKINLIHPKLMNYFFVTRVDDCYYFSNGEEFFIYTLGELLNDTRSVIEELADNIKNKIYEYNEFACERIKSILLESCKTIDVKIGSCGSVKIDGEDFNYLLNNLKTKINVNVI